jgi:hypothetical protein
VTPFPDNPDNLRPLTNLSNRLSFGVHCRNHGVVGAKLAPIRDPVGSTRMKPEARRRVVKVPSSACIATNSMARRTGVRRALVRRHWNWPQNWQDRRTKLRQIQTGGLTTIYLGELSDIGEILQRSSRVGPGILQ